MSDLTKTRRIVPINGVPDDDEDHNQQFLCRWFRRSNLFRNFTNSSFYIVYIKSALISTITPTDTDYKLEA